MVLLTSEGMWSSRYCKLPYLGAEINPLDEVTDVDFE